MAFVQIRPRCTLYLKRTRLGSYLTFLKVAANPKAITPPHISILGPYMREWSENGVQQRIEKSRITVMKASYGCSIKEQFVHLHCQSPDLKLVWFGNEYRKFSPHITIYRGVSDEEAKAVYEAIENYQFHFSFTGSGLLLTKNWGPISSIPQISFGERDICEVTGERVSMETLVHLPFHVRLFLIRKVCDYLAEEKNL